MSEAAVHMASLHPAKLLGLDSNRGSLAVGKSANLLALSSQLLLHSIWIYSLPSPL
ncbi:amidohydrolase family protein [Buttiauxella sp. A2-C1_F]|uniref:amidohydrolase family protein n=1 Tax=unclassified Buttiauxella TaxID=2634062 RepID=UPI00351DA4DD